MLNMLSQIGTTAGFYADRLRQRIQTFATMMSVFKFWLGRLFVGTESSSRLGTELGRSQCLQKHIITCMYKK